MSKELDFNFISDSENIGQTVQLLFRQVGVPVIFLGYKENDFYYKAYYALVNNEQLPSLKRAFKAVEFALLSKYANISLSHEIDGVAGALFAISIEKNERSFIALENVKDKLAPNEYFIGIDEKTGEVVKNNLLDCPHLLIAGASGSGKSTFLHNFISSFVDKKGDDNVAFLLIDTKQVEFSRYKAKKYEEHVWKGIAYDIETATKTLVTLSKLIDNRYAKMAASGDLIYKGTKQVLIIDEFADLIMRGNRFIEKALIKIAQLGRACGVHLVIATQRPSASVCTGLIKANIPCRIAFQCASKVDSRVVLEQNGAEALRGKGEALYRNAQGVIRKIQCFS